MPDMMKQDKGKQQRPESISVMTVAATPQEQFMTLPVVCRVPAGVSKT